MIDWTLIAVADQIDAYEALRRGPGVPRPILVEGGLEDADIEACIAAAKAARDEEGEAVARAIRGLTAAQRQRLWRWTGGLMDPRDDPPG